MTQRALAAPRKRASHNPSPQNAPHTWASGTTQAAAITLGVALRYLALRRAPLVKPRAPAQRPVLRVVT